MDYVTLNNGVKMPKLGFGVYQIWEADECQRSVEDALEVGYRSLDNATVYQNEAAVGDAIQASGIPRSELFLTTKLWPRFGGYDGAKKSVEESLKKLRTDYLDLYLIHEPMGDYYGSWRAMEEMVAEGTLKAIGVCNMWPDRMLDFLLHVKIKPAIHQIETHPFYQQIEARALLDEYGVRHQAWGPLAEGQNDIFHNPVLTEIAKAHGKSVAQVIFRWLLQRDIVVVTKSTHKERMKENIAVFDFTLTDAEMEKIKSLDTGKPIILNSRDLAVVKRICTFEGRITPPRTVGL